MQCSEGTSSQIRLKCYAFRVKQLKHKNAQVPLESNAVKPNLGVRAFKEYTSQEMADKQQDTVVLRMLTLEIYFLNH